MKKTILAIAALAALLGTAKAGTETMPWTTVS